MIKTKALWQLASLTLPSSYQSSLTVTESFSKRPLAGEGASVRDEIWVLPRGLQSPWGRLVQTGLHAYGIWEEGAAEAQEGHGALGS